jgi:LmbE family N-acetylglucosaminyl deacetylase
LNGGREPEERASQTGTEGRWLFLSPHADDAVWSAGGIIAASAARRPTTIVTLFDPPGDTRIARRAEDERAAALLSAGHMRVGLPEATERLGRFGPLYPSALSLRRAPDPCDPAFTEAEAALGPLLAGAEALFVPAARDSHVDHAIAHEAALRAAGPATRLFAYREFPYYLGKATDGETIGLACLPGPWEAASRVYWSEAVGMYGSEERFASLLRTFIAGEIFAQKGGWSQPVAPLTRSR